MKKLALALILLMVPVAAMAGMNAFMDMDEMSNTEMAALTGQTGITMNAQLSILNGHVAWGDSDGCNGTTATTDGWLTLSGITVSSLNITGQTIDICRVGGTSWLTIGIPSLTVVGGVANIFIDSTVVTRSGLAYDEGNSLGHLVFNLTLGSMTTQITGHD
ncbi:MAG: hypothetical protein HZB23_06305 [Deltaproteobacteria bacterium]|nr:hypothetical protein [Deltaproteobacteria bacterium]